MNAKYMFLAAVLVVGCGGTIVEGYAPEGGWDSDTGMTEGESDGLGTDDGLGADSEGGGSGAGSGTGGREGGGTDGTGDGSSSGGGDTTGSGLGTDGGSTGGPDDTGTTGEPDMGTTGEDGGSSTGEEEDAPPVVVLTSNVQLLTEGDRVEFVAEVMDPNDDVREGWLLSADGTVGYAEMDYIGGGEYRTVLSFEEIGMEEEFDFLTFEMLRFRARFTDDAGNMGMSNDVEVEFTCGGYQACEGSCAGASDNNNCGTCGTTCELGDYGDGACELGACGLKFELMWFYTSNQAGIDNCNERCGFLGKSCRENKCGGKTWLEAHEPNQNVVAHSGGCGDTLVPDRAAVCCCE